MTGYGKIARLAVAAGCLGSGVLLLAACGVKGSPSGSSTVTVTTTPSANSKTSSASPSTAAACTTSTLHASLGQPGAAAGSAYYPIIFTNTSSSACTLYGYPGVSFVTGPGGSQVGAAATENPAQAKKLITLAPDGSANALLQVVDAENYPNKDCGLVTAHWLKIYPPNQSSALYLSFSAKTCAKPGKAVHNLGVQTVQAGKGGH
jgi:type II secretory pathway component GspD/PulD (secretin)